MEKVKVIKGTPVYKYRGTQSLDQIPKLIVKEMLYNPEENITYVKLKRRSILLEIICSFVILACVTISVINYDGVSIKCNYNSLVNYYDNKLFLNWQNPKENRVDITFELLDDKDVVYKAILKPGESVIYIDLMNVKDKYDCTMTSSVLTKTISESVVLTVINRELQQGE